MLGKLLLFPIEIKQTMGRLSPVIMEIAMKNQASRNWTDRDVQYIMKWTQFQAIEPEGENRVWVSRRRGDRTPTPYSGLGGSCSTTNTLA